jgi:hypothetical protein
VVHEVPGPSSVITAVLFWVMAFQQSNHGKKLTNLNFSWKSQGSRFVMTTETSLWSSVTSFFVEVLRLERVWMQYRQENPGQWKK